jgi:uncharacterized protein with HEPN domain
MRKDDVVRIRHMLDAANECLLFTKGKSRTSLNTDRQLVLALTKSVEILGEAAARISKETRDCSPQIPWNSIVSMRNRLIHAYFDIDLDILWKTIIEDIPPLIPKIENLLLDS